MCLIVDKNKLYLLEMFSVKVFQRCIHPTSSSSSDGLLLVLTPDLTLD